MMRSQKRQSPSKIIRPKTQVNQVPVNNLFSSVMTSANKNGLLNIYKIIQDAEVNSTSSNSMHHATLPKGISKKNIKDYPTTEVAEPTSARKPPTGKVMQKSTSRCQKPPVP